MPRADGSKHLLSGSGAAGVRLHGIADADDFLAQPLPDHGIPLLQCPQTGSYRLAGGSVAAGSVGPSSGNNQKGAHSSLWPRPPESNSARKGAVAELKPRRAPARGVAGAPCSWPAACGAESLRQDGSRIYERPTALLRLQPTWACRPGAEARQPARLNASSLLRRALRRGCRAYRLTGTKAAPASLRSAAARRIRFARARSKVNTAPHYRR